MCVCVCVSSVTFSVVVYLDAGGVAKVVCDFQVGVVDALEDGDDVSE